MNWDWDKLEEKKRHQQPRDGGGKGKKETNHHDERDDEDESFFGGNNNGNGNNGNDNNSQKPHKPRAPRRPTPPIDLSKIKFSSVKWVVLAIVLLWIVSGFYIVRPDESGVVIRFGAYARTESEGLHYHLPYPIEEVYLPKVSQIRQAEVGFRSQRSGASFQQGQFVSVNEESAMLTGDENIVNIQFSIQYHIKPNGAVDYLFNVTQPDAIVKKAAEAAMREIIGKTSLDAALTKDRIKIQDDVTSLLQTILDRYKMGVQVVAVQMQDVQPPLEVREAFKDVASAREDKERLTNEAEAYRRDILPKAHGSAAAIINQAEAYKQARVHNATGEASRFLAILTEYEKAKDVTRKRLLLETLEQILSNPNMDKIILPSGMTNQVLPFLPLTNNLNTSQNTIPSNKNATNLIPSQITADTHNNMQNIQTSRPNSRGSR